MRLLILGYSSIAERRVIPAAAKAEAIEEISIASKSRPQPGQGDDPDSDLGPRHDRPCLADHGRGEEQWPLETSS